MLAVVAFTLILFDRGDEVYLWVGAVLLLLAANYGIWRFRFLDPAPEHRDRPPGVGQFSDSADLRRLGDGVVDLVWAAAPARMPYIVAGVTVLS